MGSGIKACSPSPTKEMAKISKNCFKYFVESPLCMKKPRRLCCGTALAKALLDLAARIVS